MSDETDRGSAGPLERPDRIRRPRIRRLASLALVLGVGIAIARPNPDALSPHRAQDCAAAVKNEATDALRICKLEYQRTQDPFTGVRVATAMNSDGDSGGAKREATRFLPTPATSDALYLLSQIARSEGDHDYETSALQQARELHRSEHKPRELGRDDGALAMTRMEHQEYAEALRLLDECIMQARLANDQHVESYCRTGAATTLIHIGYMDAADQEIEQVHKLLTSAGHPTKPRTSDTEGSDLEYQYGSYYQESGQHASAIAKFANALRLRGTAADPDWASTTEINIAYSYAETNELDEAQRHLDAATLLDIDRAKEPERTSVAARIAYRSHDLSRAAALLDHYFQLVTQEDDDRETQIDSAILGARIALERADFEHAETWARRGVAQVEAIRSSQGVLELRPWILAKWRVTYELLFTAFARGHRVEDAAMAFDQWQGRTVQDALARSHPPASLDYRGIADRITLLGTWLRVASRAPLARPADQASVLQTMHDIDLVALIVADGDIWRLAANHGAPTLSRIAALGDVEELITRLRGQATNAEVASKLGALLLPESAFRSTHDVLHIVLDSQLHELPVAALRHGSSLLIERRPITYLHRLPETRCIPADRPGHATVIGVQDQTIPYAVSESRRVAELLHATSEVDGDATRSALFAAKADAVLHVAAHGEIGKDGPALILADGNLSALEISARGVGPSLVVLSACYSAVSDDPELSDSLASGFIGAGSQHVIATLRQVSDRGSIDFAMRFYQANGVADPIRALAAVQSQLAKTDRVGTEPDWPYYAVFGADVCRTTSQH